MKFRDISAKKGVALIFIVILFVFTVLNFSSVWNGTLSVFNVFKPFFVGLIFAYFINMPMHWMETHWFTSPTMKNKRLISLSLAILFVLFVVVTVLLIVVPLLATSILELVKAMPSYITSLQKMMEPYASQLPQIEDMLESTEELIPTLSSKLTEFVSSNLSNYLSVTGAYVAVFLEKISRFFVSFVCAILVLLNKESLKVDITNTLKAYTSPSFYRKWNEVMSMGNKIMKTFILGNCMEAILNGILFYIVLWVLGFKYVALYAVLIAVCSLVPIIGKSFANTVSLILILISQGPIKAVIFFVVGTVIGQLMSAIIKPKLIKNQAPLPALWTFVIVTFGVQYLDFWGVFFCIPLAGLTYKLIEMNIEKHLSEKHLEVEKV